MMKAHECVRTHKHDDLFWLLSVLGELLRENVIDADEHENLISSFTDKEL